MRSKLETPLFPALLLPFSYFSFTLFDTSGWEAGDPYHYWVIGLISGIVACIIGTILLVIYMVFMWLERKRGRDF